jgi:hypothetical protein
LYDKGYKHQESLTYTPFTGYLFAGCQEGEMAAGIYVVLALIGLLFGSISVAGYFSDEKPPK